MEKGLRILKSMSESGLLLNPEIIPLTEPLADGTWSSSVSNIQKRACFTLIEPSELQKHSILFGHFALEFDVDTMRQLGAIPAFYYPNPKNDVGLEATAISLLCRMGEIQQLLNRLTKFEEQIRNPANKNRVLALINNISGEAEDIDATFGGAAKILDFLAQDRSLPVLGNALRAISGLFCPTDDPTNDNPLHNYRLREWRIIANMAKLGEEQTRDLSDGEVNALLEIDREFFGREMRFHTGIYPQYEQCKYFQELEGRPFLSYARRVIVPDEAVGQAIQIQGDGLPPVVAASEVYGSSIQ